jgi:hypothetical protein
MELCVKLVVHQKIKNVVFWGGTILPHPQLKEREKQLRFWAR